MQAPPPRDLGFRLSRLSRALRRRWAGDLAPLGLTPPQAAILCAVAASPGSGLRALARTLGSDPMNVKRCVDDLEARGLVRSGSHQRDRRPRTLRLTAPGERLAEEAARLAREQEAWVTAPLPPGQRRCLEVVLDSLDAILFPPADGVAAVTGPRPVPREPGPGGRDASAREVRASPWP